MTRALQLINEGYLNSASLTSLAERLGVGVRYLRKLFEQQVGVAPSVVAQTQRLHLAQKLLLETAMPITDIAFSSGFGSVRRFNSATLQNFGCSPGELRRRPALVAKVFFLHPRSGEARRQSRRGTVVLGPATVP